MSFQDNNATDTSLSETDTRLNQDFNVFSLLKFTMPTVFLMMFASLYTAVDGFFISNFDSENAFASVNIVFPWTSTLLAVGLMLGSGGCAILSRQMGEQKTEQASRNLSQLTLFTILIGLILTAIGVLFAEPISVFLGATDILKEDAVVYLSVISCFAVPSLLQLCSQMFFIADGRPEFGFFIGTLGGITNIVLDYIFIAVFDMGVLGAALATGTGYSIPAITFLLYFARRKKTGLKFAKPKFDLSILVSTCFNGASEMVTGIAGSITAFLFNIIILDIAGETGVVAVGVVMYAQFLFQSAFLGFAQGVSPLISYNYGANKPDRLKFMLKTSIITNLVAGVCIYGFVLLSAGLISDIYLDKTSEAYELTKTGLIIFGISFIPQGVNIFASGMFTALSNGRISAMLSFFRTLLLIVVFVIVLPHIIGITGIWLAIPFAEIISIMISTFVFIKLKNVYNY